MAMEVGVRESRTSGDGILGSGSGSGIAWAARH